MRLGLSISSTVKARRGTRRGNPELKTQALPCDSLASHSLLAKAGGLLHFVRNDELGVAIQSKTIPL